VSTVLFLGIDGGGTRTRAFLTDAEGQVGVWAGAGLTNPIHASPGELRANLRLSVEGAFAQLHLQPSACRSAFVGMAGVTTAAGRNRVQSALADCGLAHTPIGVDHDIRIALAGGLALRPGMALIVGTGSSCYGRTADGRTWQTGGWEALISDEGSAFFLAREAIAAAARMADGRCRETPLRQAVFGWLGIHEIADVLPRIHDQGLTRSEMAAFAPQVVRLAEQGDPAALEVLNRGAALLAEMVVGNHRMLPTGPGPDVVITGGLGTAPTIYREKIVRAIRDQLPSASVHPPLLAPAIGAALLAMKQVNQAVTADLLRRLERFNP
jgi:N-acetylglucosamine kinase-like BadF-type ATPase